MFHTIEFLGQFAINLEISPKGGLERFITRKGTQIRTKIKPHVEETPDGPVEVADLFFEDGTITRAVPYDYFSFVE